MRSFKVFIVLALAMAMTSGFRVSAASFSDIEGHYAEAAIESMAAKGVIHGMDNGTFAPDSQVTRAQFVAMINRALGFTAETKHNFSDVSSEAWYAKDIAIAVKAGYLVGSGGKVLPDAVIMRQEAAQMVFEALGAPVSETEGAAHKFNDDKEIAAWADRAVQATAVLGIFAGDTNNNFMPLAHLTRAQAAIVAEKMLAQPKPEEVAEDLYLANTTIEGTLTITNPGVTVENVVVTGDLVIDESVGDGSVILKSVKVEGETRILGGGTESIECIDCEFGSVYVSYEDGNVHVIIDGGFAGQVVFTANGRLEVRGEGSVETVVIADNLGISSRIAIEGAVDKITVESPVDLTIMGNVGEIDMLAGASLRIGSGSDIGIIAIAEAAAGAKVDIPANAVVSEAVVDGKTAFTGTGAPETAMINASGVTAVTAPKELKEGSKKTEKPSASGPISGPSVAPSTPSTPSTPSNPSTQSKEEQRAEEILSSLKILSPNEAIGTGAKAYTGLEDLTSLANVTVSWDEAFYEINIGEGLSEVLQLTEYNHTITPDVFSGQDHPAYVMSIPAYNGVSATGVSRAYGDDELEEPSANSGGGVETISFNGDLTSFFDVIGLNLNGQTASYRLGLFYPAADNGNDHIEYYKVTVNKAAFKAVP